MQEPIYIEGAMIPSVNPIGGLIVSPSLSKIDQARRLRTQERRVYIIWKSSDYKVQGQQRKSHPIDVIYEKKAKPRSPLQADQTKSTQEHK